jgi:hypothetical protein
VLVEAAQGRRGPPVPLTQERDQRRHQQGADDGRVDQHGHRGADAQLLDEDDLRGREGLDGDAEQDRGGGDRACKGLKFMTGILLFYFVIAY